MKEEQQHLHHHHHQQRKIITAKKLTRPTAYVLLLLLSYVLGYLSSPSSSSVHSPNAGTASIPTTTSAVVAELDIVTLPVPLKLVRQTILDQVFNGTSSFDSFPLPHVAHLLRPKRIKGWGSNGAVFENLIWRVKPRTIIEVGTFLGTSAITWHGTPARNAGTARPGPARPCTISPRTYGPCRAISFPFMGRLGPTRFLSGPY